MQFTGGTRASSKTWVRSFTDLQVNLLTDSSPLTLASYIAIVQLLFHLCGNIAFAWALWEKQRLWFPVSTRLTPNLSTHSLTQTTPKTRVPRINSGQNIETCFTGLKSTFHCLQRCYGHFSSFCYYYYMTMTIIFTPASLGEDVGRRNVDETLPSISKLSKVPFCLIMFAWPKSVPDMKILTALFIRWTWRIPKGFSSKLVKWLRSQ